MGRGLARAGRAAAVVALALGLAAAAAAQSGSLRGKVVDEDGEPLEGVEVRIEFLGGVQRTRTTTTKADGTFVQVGLPTGNYRVSFAKEGYRPATTDVKVLVGTTVSTEEVRLPRLPEGATDPAATPEAQELFQKGVDAANAGDFRAAVDAFEKFLALAPDTAEAYYNAAVGYERLGEADKARAYYEKTVELRPEHVEARMALADLASERRDWDAAAAALRRVVELDPDRALAWYNLGAVEMNRADMAAAEAFRKAVELDPGRPEAHYQLGMVLVGQGETDEAVEHLEKYLALAPDGPNAATARSVLEQLKKSP